MSGFPSGGGSGVPLSTVTTAGDLIVGTGAGAVARLGSGAANTVLTGQGVGVAPAYSPGGSFPLSPPLAGQLAGAPVALGGAATLMTTAVLAVGTWKVSFSVAIEGTSAVAPWWGALRIVLGSATATFAGPQGAEVGALNSTVLNNNGYATFETLVTVTVAGTIICQGSGANSSAVNTGQNSAVPLMSGWTAERVQ